MDMDTTKTFKILLVEDDVMIASGLVYALEQEGYEVKHCDTLSCALDAIRSDNFDLALLDMQLPDGTGMQVHESLESLSLNTIVIYLTVVDDEANVVRALEDGAADYVTKPFRLRELLARVARALSFSNTGEKEHLERIIIDKLVIDIAAGKVFVNDEIVDLSALEYRLLLALASKRGRLLSRAQIIDSIWDDAGDFVEDNTLTVYIKRLREKLGEAITIETVRGMGYRVN
jgi:DNA-binding response OmpR family regulator